MVVKVKEHVIFETVYDKIRVNIWFILPLFFCRWTFICFSFKINQDLICWKCFESCLYRNQSRNVKEFWHSAIRICIWWIIVLFKCSWDEKLDDTISRYNFWVVQDFLIYITIMMLISQTYQKYNNTINENNNDTITFYNQTFQKCTLHNILSFFTHL